MLIAKLHWPGCILEYIGQVAYMAGDRPERQRARDSNPWCRRTGLCVNHFSSTSSFYHFISFHTWCSFVQRGLAGKSFFISKLHTEMEWEGITIDCRGSSSKASAGLHYLAEAATHWSSLYRPFGPQRWHRGGWIGSVTS